MSYKVLIADDEPNIVVSLEFLMKREGYEVEHRARRPAGARLVRSLRPDLVLLDVMMPSKTGFEVLQAVRADEAIAGTKILMLTAKGRETDTAKGLALGADAYMTKPFSTSRPGRHGRSAARRVPARWARSERWPLGWPPALVAAYVVLAGVALSLAGVGQLTAPRAGSA